jgi:hypothetical protein
MKTQWIAVGGLVLLSGCATQPYMGQARDVKRKPQDGGVVSIPTNFRDEDRARAEDKMRSNCGQKPFQVLEEGEIAVGEETKTSGRETDRASTETSVGSLFGMNIISGEAGGKDTSSSSVKTAVKEWHISYKCDSGKSVRR